MGRIAARGLGLRITPVGLRLRLSVLAVAPGQKENDMNKFDYEYLRTNNIEGWQQEWKQLLEGRFIVQDNKLVEDSNSPIFRLGFTVGEVEAAINFSGLSDREIEWRQSHPDRYQWVDEEWIEVIGWEQARENEAMSQAVIEKMLDIQRHKCLLRDGGVIIDGILWDTDSSAQGMYTQTMLMMQIDPTFVVPDWKASAGVYTEMSLPVLTSVLMEWKDFVSGLTTNQKKKEDELLVYVGGGATAEQIASYDHTTGWAGL